jgi:hypothetical protein
VPDLAVRCTIASDPERKEKDSRKRENGSRGERENRMNK